MKALIADDVQGEINDYFNAFRTREAGKINIMIVVDLERNEFLPDVRTMMDQGLDVDNASVDFRVIMVTKSTPQ